MICFKCENEDAANFFVEERNVEQIYKDIQVTVKIPVTVCKLCGWETLTLGQATELFNKTKQAFASRITI